MRAGPAQSSRRSRPGLPDRSGRESIVQGGSSLASGAAGHGATTFSRLRGRGLWLSVGLTNHSSRRLRRGLTQALGLQQRGLLCNSKGSAILALLGIRAARACPAPPSRQSRSRLPDRFRRKPHAHGGPSKAFGAARLGATTSSHLPARTQGLSVGLTTCSSGRRTAYLAHVIAAAGAA